MSRVPPGLGISNPAVYGSGTNRQYPPVARVESLEESTTDLDSELDCLSYYVSQSFLAAGVVRCWRGQDGKESSEILREAVDIYGEAPLEVVTLGQHAHRESTPALTLVDYNIKLVECTKTIRSSSHKFPATQASAPQPATPVQFPACLETDY